MRIHDEWLLTPQRIAVHLPTATAIVADLHLGYCEARRQGGDAIPLLALPTILQPLEDALKSTRASRLVIAGDLFEKTYLPALWHELLHWLEERGIELAGVVPGNHDRAWDEPAPLYPDGFPLGDWRVIHGHLSAPGKRFVLGHWHPAMYHREVLSPCFLANERELVLPAFSRDAAGVNVLPLTRWQGYRCFVIDGASVVDLGLVRRARNSPTSTSKTAKRSRPWQGRLRPG